MKVCIVSNSLSGGGAETSMRVLNHEFNRLGIPSVLLCINSVDNDQPLEHELVLNRKWSSGIKATIESLNGFKEAIFKIDPDTIILNCELPELFGSFISTRKIKLIGVEHTSIPWFKRRSLGLIVRFVLLLKSTQWVTVNKEQKYIWPYRNKCTHIPNSLRDGVLELNNSHPAAPFVFVGRLRAEKDPATVLEAARRLNTVVEVFGNGELFEKLNFDFGLFGIFHGFVSNPWVAISRQQVVVVPSKFEGDGLVIVEAIARNQPVLLRDITDLRRFQLEEHNYFSSLESLILKMQDILENGPEKYCPTMAKTEEYVASRALSSVSALWVDYLGR